MLARAGVSGKEPREGLGNQPISGRLAHSSTAKRQGIAMLVMTSNTTDAGIAIMAPDTVVFWRNPEYMRATFTEASIEMPGRFSARALHTIPAAAALTMTWALALH